MRPPNGGCLVAALLLAACSPQPETTEEPQPIPGATPFTYPIDLWDRRVQGETLLLVHVTERGDVDSAKVHTSSGFEAFDSAAVQGAQRLRFAPARQGDRRVSMWTKVPVRFSLDTLTAKVAGADSSEARRP